MSLALSDVQKDPRYYRGVSDRVHYETRSILCSPIIAHGRTFGCMELVNRRESPVFTEYEVGMLSYIAHQGALFLDTLRVSEDQTPDGWQCPRGSRAPVNL